VISVILLGVVAVLEASKKKPEEERLATEAQRKAEEQTREDAKRKDFEEQAKRDAEKKEEDAQREENIPAWRIEADYRR